jgi:hypothetical protein
MTIALRPAQCEVLARIPEQPFVDEVLGRLRADPPGPAAPLAAALEGWVRGCMERAHAHGITHQRHVWQFVKLSRELGAGFEREPWAREILELDLGGGTKINALWHEVKRREEPAPGSA